MESGLENDTDELMNDSDTEFVFERRILKKMTFLITQLTFTCSKLTIETVKQGVKYVQS